MSALTLKPTSGGTERRPGDTLELLASWSLASAPESLEARLFWFTQGKGTQDVGVVETQPIDVPGPQGERRIRFKLPDTPYSFSGTLITLAWGVELIAGDEEAARWEFVMAPGGREIRLGTTDAARLR
jgi:hypothetical protein